MCFIDGDDSFGGAVFESCDQESEFKALDQASVLEQLNKDEAEVNKYNLVSSLLIICNALKEVFLFNYKSFLIAPSFLQTPSDSKLTSFTQTPQETEQSMGSYFREKSDKMGQLSSRLSPQHRVSGVECVTINIV